jgi:hypothetical protein
MIAADVELALRPWSAGHDHTETCPTQNTTPTRRLTMNTKLAIAAVVALGAAIAPIVASTASGAPSGSGAPAVGDHSSHAGHEHANAASGTKVPAETRAALAALKQDLRKYADPAAAVAAGFIPSDQCAALPDGSAGMGYHYVDPTRIGAAPDLAHPAMLVYVPTPGGGRTLGAAEWFQPDADQDLSTDGDRPSLGGVPFDGPMPGHGPGMPVHYDLHAWLLKANPDGLFAAFNPQVSC